MDEYIRKIVFVPDIYIYAIAELEKSDYDPADVSISEILHSLIGDIGILEDVVSLLFLTHIRLVAHPEDPRTKALLERIRDEATDLLDEYYPEEAV